MKLRPAWMMVIVVFLVIASLAAIKYLERVPLAQIEAYFGVSTSNSRGSENTSPSPKITPTGGDQSASLGSLVVQTFSGSKFLRQGPATAVSADGLLVAFASIAPYGSGAYTYQVIAPQGQITRATRVAYDSKSGLVLLQAQNADFDAVLFESAQLFAGRQLEVVMSRSKMSQIQMMRLPLWVVSVSTSTEVLVSIDRSYAALFHGARVVDGAYRSLGLFQYGSQSSMIPAEVINDFIDSYLATQITP